MSESQSAVVLLADSLPKEFWETVFVVVFIIAFVASAVLGRDD